PARVWCGRSGIGPPLHFFGPSTGRDLSVRPGSGLRRESRRSPPRLCSRYSGAGAHIRIEFQRDRVHAIAVAGRLGAVREHVPEVAAAAGARDLGATHPKCTVFMELHGAPLDRLPETRPAGPRLEFRLRAEQLSSTTGSPING